MRKKWTYVAIVSMMLGVAPVFTGCVDTDEPAGINELRGAKAELLRAKAAVEQANAQWVLADAQYREALARHENALAAQAEYEAEKRKLEAEMMAAQNEKDKIWLQKEIELIQQEMERNAIVHQQTMLQLQMNFEQTRLAYEQLMKEIEIAEATGNGVPTSIATLKKDVQEKYAVLYGGRYTDANDVVQEISLEASLYYKLQKAQESVYNISLNHANGIVDSDGSKYIPMLKLHVADAEATVEAEKEALEKLQNFLKNDVETTDWRAEIAELETTIAQIEKDIDAKKVELAKAENSDSYRAASQALYGVYGTTTDAAINPGSSGVEGSILTGYPENWDKATSDGAWQVYMRSVQDLYKLKVETEFTLEGDKMETEVSDALNDLLGDVQLQLDPSASRGNWQEDLAYDDITYRYYYQDPTTGAESLLSFDDAKGEYPSTTKGAIDVKDLFGNFQYWKEILAKATENNYQNAIEVARLEKTKLETEIKNTYKPAYDNAVTDWNIALKALKGEASNITEHRSYKAISDVFAAYNTKYTTLVSKVNTYNTNYSSKYTEGYDAEMAKQEDKVLYSDGLKAGGLADYNNKGFDLTSATNEIAQQTIQNRANFEAVIRKHCTAYGEYTADNIYARVIVIVNNYVADILEEDSSISDAAKQAGLTAAQGVKRDEVVTANGELLAAIDDLNAAFAAFDALAASPYAQVRTTAAIAAATNEVLVGIYNDKTQKYELQYDGTDIAGYVEEVDQTTGLTTLKVAVSKIDATEITKATATKLEPTLAESAWQTASVAAFGQPSGYVDGDYRATEPTLDEILAAYNNGAGVSAGSAYALKQQKVKDKEDAINSVADLGKLKKEVDDAYEVLVNKFKTEYEETFAKAETAVEENADLLLEAEAKLIEAEEAFVGIKNDIALLEAQWKAQTAVRSSLITAVEIHLGIDLNNSTTGTTPSTTYDPESFEEDLAKAVADQEKVVANAEYSLAQLKIQLTQAEDGQFDDLSYAQMQLDVANYNFNTAWEAYQEALENLQKGLAVAADEAEEEQPAE